MARVRRVRAARRASLRRFIVISENGERVWWAESKVHAEEQHENAFGGQEGEAIIGTRLALRARDTWAFDLYPDLPR